MRNSLIIVWSLLLIHTTVSGQVTLSLKEAYELALMHNFSIQIASNELEIAKKNNVIGEAGMLPNINGVINQDNQVIDTKQKFLSGAENNRNGARSNSLNAGVELNWTLFNGMKMFATKKRLAELEAMGSLRLKQQIELTLSRVSHAYLDALLAKEQWFIATQLLKIGEKRLEVAKAKFAAGKSAKSEVLNVQVNLNADQANARKLETLYKNNKLQLLQLLGLSSSFVFEISDAWVSTKTISFEAFKESALQNNIGIQLSKLNKEVSLSRINELKGDRYPSVQFRTGYNYTQQESEAGFLQSSNNKGLHYGFGVNFPVFNGFDLHRKIDIARINQRSAELYFKDSVQKLEIAVSQAYENYLSHLALYQFEDTNVNLSKENYDLARDQQENGLLSINDLRMAEVNYMQSMQRKFQAAYEAKLSEIELERLSGKLLGK